MPRGCEPHVVLPPARPLFRPGRPSRRARSHRRAFTLVEVYVSLLIVAAALTIATSLFFAGRQRQAEAGAAIKAAFLAETLLTEAEVTPSAARAALPDKGELSTADRFAYAPNRFFWERRTEPTPDGAQRVSVRIGYRLPNQGEPRWLEFAEEFYP